MTHPIAGSRGGRGGGAIVVLALLVVLWAPSAEATFRYGDIMISGNLESQQLFRVDRTYKKTFQAFDLIQQRNTFRLQYEHVLVNRGNLWQTDWEVPGIHKLGFFGYYRFVYDSVYDIAPGPRFREQTGGVAGSFDTLSREDQKALRFENVIREIFVDVDLEGLPVTLRIGRQQIVWGSTVNFRALDNANALDLSWHLQQEAGILGRVGFSELRIPAWAVKALVNVGTFGPVSGSYLEVFDIPFQFAPTRVSFYPRPWGLRTRNPFRGGLALDVGELGGGPALGLNVMPCFDNTASQESNSEANPDFELARETGFCPAEGMQRSRLAQGLYDNHDPMDVNQVGARFGGSIPALKSLGFTLNYKYGRHIADATGGTAAKAQGGLVAANPQDFITPTAPFTQADPLTGETNTFVGFLRVPLEFYYPYVSVFGVSLDYYDEFTAAVYNLEVAATKGVPIANVGSPNGIERKWEMEIALLIDRPTWIRFLNPRSTFTTLIQQNVSFLPTHEGLERDEDGNVIDGDVGLPNSTLIPGQFGDVARIDERHQFETLTVIAMQTFYKGGSISPLVAFVWDWTNMPGAELIAAFQYLPYPSLIVEPTVRIFWTDGRIVDDRYGVTQNAGRSELQLKFTYQF